MYTASERRETFVARTIDTTQSISKLLKDTIINSSWHVIRWHCPVPTSLECIKAEHWNRANKDVCSGALTSLSWNSVKVVWRWFDARTRSTLCLVLEDLLTLFSPWWKLGRSQKRRVTRVISSGRPKQWWKCHSWSSCRPASPADHLKSWFCYITSFESYVSY